MFHEHTYHKNVFNLFQHGRFIADFDFYSFQLILIRSICNIHQYKNIGLDPKKDSKLVRSHVHIHSRVEAIEFI